MLCCARVQERKTQRELAFAILREGQQAFASREREREGGGELLPLRERESAVVINRDSCCVDCYKPDFQPSVRVMGECACGGTPDSQP